MLCRRFYLSRMSLFRGFLQSNFDGRFILLAYAVLVPLALRGYGRWDRLPVLRGLGKVIDRVLRALA